MLEKRKIKHSVYDVTINGTPVEQAIVHTKFGDVLPSSADLAGAGVELIGTDNRERQLAKALDRVKDQYDVIFIDCPPSLEIFGVVLTMFDGRTNFSTQVAQEVRRHFPGKVFASVVPRNIRLAEAPSHGLPVTSYDRSSRGSVAYKALAEEIAGKL